MRASLWSVAGGALVAAGCSSAFSAGTGGSTGAGGSGSSSSGGTTTTSTTSTTTTTTTACPSEAGAYSLSTMGLGCGDLDPTAKECIKATVGSCEHDLTTTMGTLGLGVAGMVDVGQLGNFQGADLTLGTVARTGCNGAWKPSGGATDPATLTITCGGMSAAQSCTVTLTRTGDCP